MGSSQAILTWMPATSRVSPSVSSTTVRAHVRPLQSQIGRMGRLKKVMKYVFSGQPELRAACCHLLRVQPGQVTAEEYLEQITQQVRKEPHCFVSTTVVVERFEWWRHNLLEPYWWLR